MTMVTQSGTVPSMSEAVPSLDGRRARRIANRDAVIDALLELFASGVLTPSAAAIAERAGVSERSIFRYFDDLGDLVQAAVERFTERHAEDFGIEVDPEWTLAQRILAVADRITYQRQVIGGIAIVARARAPFQPIIADVLARRRRFTREQLALAFAPELDRLDVRTRQMTLVAIDAACSFESQTLVNAAVADAAFTAHQVLVHTLTRLLAGL